MKRENVSDKIIEISLTEYPEFSDRLKLAMELRGYSTYKLATRIFVSHSAISGYRAGARMPDWQILCLIARELDVTSDFLLGLDNHLHL